MAFQAKLNDGVNLTWFKAAAVNVIYHTSREPCGSWPDL